jgi:lipoate-protein ligase A
MARVLRVPDEKYRDKVFQSIRENLTTLKRETGRLPTWDEMAGPLIRRFESVLGPLEEAALPQSVRDKADALQPTFLSEEWLYKKRRQTEGRDVKIATGVNVQQRIHKAPGGLIRATLEISDGRLTYVSLSGDFFCYPQDAIGDLEAALEGTPVQDIESALNGFYAGAGDGARGEIETPGVTVADWMQVLGG